MKETFDYTKQNKALTQRCKNQIIKLEEAKQRYINDENLYSDYELMENTVIDFQDIVFILSGFDFYIGKHRRVLVAYGDKFLKMHTLKVSLKLDICKNLIDTLQSYVAHQYFFNK